MGQIYLLYVSLVKRANIKYDLKLFYNGLFLCTDLKVFIGYFSSKRNCWMI